MATINHGQDRRDANADWFTGKTWMTVLSEPDDPEGVRVVDVDFSPGARSDWHSHPGGQVLHILSGEGVVANEGGQVLTMKTGDTVTVPIGEIHWHGSVPESSMSQMSITSGGATEWIGRSVTDEEYREAVGGDG